MGDFALHAGRTWWAKGPWRHPSPWSGTAAVGYRWMSFGGMPSLLKVVREYESQGFVLLAVNKDEAGSAKAAVGVFIANRVPDLASHVVFADARMAINYRIQSLPTSYFIGRDGMVLDAQAGYLPERTLRKKIESALSTNQ